MHVPSTNHTRILLISNYTKYIFFFYRNPCRRPFTEFQWCIQSSYTQLGEVKLKIIRIIMCDTCSKSLCGQRLCWTKAKNWKHKTKATWLAVRDWAGFYKPKFYRRQCERTKCKRHTCNNYDKMNSRVGPRPYCYPSYTLNKVSEKCAYPQCGVFLLPAN